jgi:rhodanese-related sulfurtransferase
MDAGAAHALLGEALFLDVRKSHEYDAGHIPGALWLPLRDLPARLDHLDRRVPVVTTCQVGQRSGVAADFLRDQGFDAHNLEGGLDAWVAGGFPLVSSDGRSGRVIDGWAEGLEL